MVSPVADGNKYGDTIQLNIMQTVGKLGILNLKWVISNKSFFQGSGNPMEKEETETV